MLVVPETVGEVITGKDYKMQNFDKTIDLDTDKVYDLNGITGTATDTWKIINGIVCRRFDHVTGAESILADSEYSVMWFYLPDISRQDHLAMGLFEKVTADLL